MGTYTLTDFRAQIDQALGRSIDAGNTKQDRFINQALFTICGAFRHDELVTEGSFNTVAATAQYSLAADCFVVLDVLDSTTPNYIRWIRISEYYRRFANSNGTVEFWTRIGAKIALHKTPGAALAIKYPYQKNAAKLTAAGDITAINSAWDSVVYHLSTCFAMLSVNEEARAAAFFQTAVSLAQAIVPDDERLAKLSIETGFPKLTEAQLQAAGGQG